MHTIIVGSTNAAKVGAVTRAARAYWPAVTVAAHEVESGVPAQPIGLEQTMLGALNRARAACALGAPGGQTLGVGLESGLMEMAGRWVLFGVVAVSDGTRETAVPGMGMPLPDDWAAMARNGGDVGRHLGKMQGDATRHVGIMPYLSNNVVQREDTFAAATCGALAPWVSPEAFATQDTNKSHN